MPTNWTCPYCNRVQTLTNGQSTVQIYRLKLAEHRYGEAGYTLIAKACANPDCGEITLRGQFTKGETKNGNDGYGYYPATIVQADQLRPSSEAKPFPTFIPKALRDDYEEACKIRELSPKSSATLARRCLQGMIRDFCGISLSRLVDEVSELKKRVENGKAPSGVTEESVEAIDHVRQIGNIGAHMERDVNLVVEIEPGEARALIDLIELLFDEWYVSREKRKNRLAEITRISERKKIQKKGANNEPSPDSAGGEGEA